MLSARLNIITALPCEARPLIQRYKLQRQHTWPVYCDKDKRIYLAVSGPGKVKAACATTFLAIFKHSHPAAYFLNLGIAGGYQHTIGDIFRIHKITDNDTQQAWYPSLNHHSSLASDALTTVAEAKTDYRPQNLVDMEAAGFFQAANLHVSQEQNHVLKIISDNKHSPDINLNAKTVEQLINAQMENIDTAIKILLALSHDETQQQLQLVDFDWITTRWHFSQYQQHQLQELLRRWQVNHKNTDLHEKISKQTQAKDILNYLQTTLEIPHAKT